MFIKQFSFIQKITQYIKNTTKYKMHHLDILVRNLFNFAKITYCKLNKKHKIN